MRRIWLLLLLMMLLTGCKSIADIKPDTIVDIPLHPTGNQTADAAETPAAAMETERASEVAEPAKPATQPPKTNTGSGAKPSGSKKPGQAVSGREPSATQPSAAAPTEPSAVTSAYDPSGYVPGNLDRAVADLINGQRKQEGIAALRLDSRLCAIAAVRAWETAQTWSSNRPDGGSGITVLAEYGYSYRIAAENLYYGPADAAAMVDKWMGSDSRRANILLEAADTIGVGSYTAADGVTFVAVLFVG